MKLTDGGVFLWMSEMPASAMRQDLRAIRESPLRRAGCFRMLPGVVLSA